MNRTRQIRPKPKNRLGVDVGPFLSIVVCVIGVVVLLVCGLVAAGSLQESELKEKDRLLAEITLTEHIRDAEQMRASLKVTASQLISRLTADQQLQNQLAAAEKEAQHNLDILKDPDYLARLALAKQIIDLERAIESLNEQLKPIPAQIASVQKTISDSDNFMTIPIPNGGPAVKAIFVECQVAGLTVYQRDGNDVKNFSVDLNDIDSSNEFQRLVQTVAANAQAGGVDALNLLVRPSGVKAYDHAIAKILNGKAPYAAVPISAKGKIRFSLASITNPHTN